MNVEQGDLPEDIHTLLDDIQALCDNVGIMPLRI